jgi:hypothetical protein
VRGPQIRGAVWRLYLLCKRAAAMSIDLSPPGAASTVGTAVSEEKPPVPYRTLICFMPPSRGGCLGDMPKGSPGGHASPAAGGDDLEGVVLFHERGLEQLAIAFGNSAEVERLRDHGRLNGAFCKRGKMLHQV